MILMVEKEDFLLSLNDLWRILKKNRLRIGVFSLIVGLCGFFYSATRPIKYQAEGSFRERGKNNSGINNPLSALLTSVGADSNSSGLTVMKSKVLAEALVKKNGLQVNIAENTIRFPFPLLGTIVDNLRVEYALFTDKKTPIFSDPPQKLTAQDVHYNGESPISLRLKVDSKDTYSLFDHNNHPIGQGTFNTPFKCDALSMTLTNPQPNYHSRKNYTMTIIPTQEAIKRVQNDFTIKTNATDKHIINVFYKDPDRRQAASLVMSLMNLYTNYIKNEHKLINDEQIAYLGKRRSEIENELKNDMYQCAKTFSSDLFLTGFPSSNNAMEFLSNTQAKLESKINSNNLDIKRLEHIDADDINDYGKLILISNTPSIENLLKELRELKQYTEFLQLALQNKITPPIDFQWMSLEAAKEILVEYNKQLHATELQIIQQQFIIKQFDDPNFEISSSSKFLTDPVSAQMIHKASLLALSLKDTENLNTKEQARLKSELAIQKGFLITHLEQNVTLLELHLDFLKNKIIELQNTALALTQNQISVLEQQVRNYIVSTIYSLKEENNLLNHNIIENRIDMSSFPEKWAAERFLQQKILVSKNMTTEITRLVETKNISTNLEKSMAAPFELPALPFHPNSPRLLLFTFLGIIAGAFLSTAWFIIRSVSQGIEASSDNLKLAGQHISGPLSRCCNISENQQMILDSDLNTLRHLISFMTRSSDLKADNTLLLLENHGPQYADMLANLLSKKGIGTLIIDISLDRSQQNEGTGLFQYLQKETTELNIIHLITHDYISSGGISRYANELLDSHQFRELLSILSKKYDLVIACSNATLESAEAVNLLNLFPNVAISVSGESLQTLHPYILHNSQPGKKCTFIMMT